LVEYCDIKFGGCKEKYGIPWHRTDRIGLAGFRTGVGDGGFEGWGREGKLFLMDCQEIHRCREKFFGTELAKNARNVTF
jgi:hypothetical protein